MSSVHNEKGAAPGDVLKTSVWVLVVRIFQVLLSVVVLGLAARLVHDAYLDEEGLALAISLITWLIVAYIVLAEKIPALHTMYNIIAVMVLDGLMIILWLATFAAVAAKRAKFTFDADVDSCFNDGSLFDSKTCLRKRAVILFEVSADMLSVIAGLGALVWLLFIATFVWTVVMFFRDRKDGRFLTATNNGNYQMQAKPQPQPQPQPQPLMPQQQAPIHPQPTGSHPPEQYGPQGQVPCQQPQSPHQLQDSAYPHLRPLPIPRRTSSSRTDRLTRLSSSLRPDKATSRQRRSNMAMNWHGPNPTPVRRPSEPISAAGQGAVADSTEIYPRGS